MTLFPEHPLMVAYLGFVTLLWAAQNGEKDGREYDRAKKAVIKAR
ncbi:MAG: hypothetical protein V1495_03355 [Pseudomonadota bacterium]